MLTKWTRAIAVAALTMLASHSLAQTAEIIEHLNVPGPITFQNQSFALAWSSMPQDNYVKQEYVPADQYVEAFKDMFIVEALSGSTTPAQSASARIDLLKKRKASDPIVKYAILHNEKTGSIVLDFILSDLQADPIVVEWNAYRYVSLKNGRGVGLYGISRRAYGEADAKVMLQSLTKIREADVDALALMDVPPISVKD